MTVSIRIRRFEVSDEERMRQVESLSMRELTPISSLRRFYEIRPEGFVVAEVNGVVAGFLIANERRISGGGSEGHILSIAVDPAYRRLGVALALMKSVINSFRERSIARVVLEVKTGNRGAIEFYKRLGFEESHVIWGYYRMRGFTEDALVMFRQV